MMRLFSSMLFLMLSFLVEADEVTISNDLTSVEKSKPAPASIELSEQLVIDQRLIVLLQLNETNPRAINNQLESLQLDRATLNTAEQYLLLFLEAIVANNKKSFEQVIELVKQAHQLENTLSEKQLNQPIFAKSYLLLANGYVELKDFDNAYLAKKSYYKYYQQFTWDEYDKKVALLNDKYETEQKLNSNELLTSQNKLKQLALKESLEKNSAQQINTMLIIALTVVFFLLFFRQLKVRKQLIILAKTDSLTGLANRRSLFEQGKKLLTTLVSNNPQLSVFVVDIDYFKKVNDQCGHDVGDEVLKKLAQFGNEVMRSRDVFARLGGEEFVAILPDANLDEAKAIAERLKEKVAGFDFSDLGLSNAITISIGITTVDEHANEFEDLLHLADLAMYHAKSSGRNQVVIYQPSMSAATSRVVRTSE